MNALLFLFTDVNDRRTKTERNEKTVLKKGREKAHNLDIYIDNNGNFLFASVNGRQVPRSSRVLLASRGYVIPVPMQTNHYNMGRKNGSCHFSNTMDITGEKMMQAFERYQMQTASGVPIKREDINVKANGVIEYKSACDQDYKIFLLLASQLNNNFFLFGCNFFYPSQQITESSANL